MVGVGRNLRNHSWYFPNPVFLFRGERYCWSREKEPWYRSNLQTDDAGYGSEGDMQRDKGGRMNDDKKLIRNSTAEFLIFTGQAGEQSIEARYEDETVWLSQKLMAALFDVDVRTVNEHLKNVYEQGEVTPEATIRKFRIVQTEGKREVVRSVDFYNLDAIISVGYRVNSVRATQFRQWATRVLREFAIKGYVLDNGKITAQITKDFAESEFEKYRIMQDRLFESDFDKVMRQLESEENHSGLSSNNNAGGQ